MNFFKNLIQKHIEKLKIVRVEHEDMLRMLEVCEKGSFRYALLNKDKVFLDFKIVIWETLI
jgi:hypothetical protein